MQYDDKDAKRIAFHGARKMDGAGYTLVDIATPTSREMGIENFRVYTPGREDERPEDLHFYNVTFTPGTGWSCNCPFRKENCTCKHITRCHWEANRRRSEELERQMQEGEAAYYDQRAQDHARREEEAADARAEAADAQERYHNR